MKIVNDVKSQTKPIEIDDYTSPTTVFVRKNIREIEETDPVFKTVRKLFVYDETQYTYPEWNKIITDNITEEGKFIQEQVDVTQLAMTEIIDMIGLVMASSINETDDRISNVSKAMNAAISEYTKYSAIAKMYAGMIRRGLITIDRISPR